MDRRTFLAAGAAAAALPALTVEVSAQVYPSRPIRIVVGYPAGGQADIIARTYGEYISRQLGQPVVVENKGGAGGILGAVEVKRSPPDGYTLMVTIAATMIQNRVMVKNLPYDPDKDFVLASLMTQIGLVMAASEKTGVSNLNEFVQYAKKNDKVSLGSWALGSAAHLIAVELNKQYGLNIEPVHYRGEAPMWTDVGGQSLDAAVGSYNAALPVLQSGRGKALATTGLQRLPVLPDVATMVEQGASSKLYELRGFTCFAAPASTPPDVIKKLSDVIVAGAADPKVRQTMDQFFLNPPIPHGEAQKLFAEQTPLFIEFLEGVGIRPE
jgi:tripartite-type tricarboxylate transporter receptor subunit TctC